MSNSNSGLTQDKAKAIAIIIIVVVVLAVGVFFVSKTFGSLGDILKKLGIDLGLTKDPLITNANNSNIAENLKSSVPTSPFSPQFYKDAPDGAALITVADATNLCGQIWDTVPWYALFGGIDATGALAAFKQLSTQSQVSFLVDNFNTLYSKDLYDWMGRQYTSDTNILVLQQIVTYVTSLPQYF